MKFPSELYKQIVDFFISLPNIHDNDSQRAFIYHAGLDPELQNQIPFGKPIAQFAPVLVTILLNYGNLYDGKNALETVLEATKSYVGIDKQEECDELLSKLQTEIERQEFKELQDLTKKKGTEGFIKKERKFVLPFKPKKLNLIITVTFLGFIVTLFSKRPV